ncbi:MAG: FAD-binding protein [Bosea sp.]|jgi:glycolate oxidase FAD binding subunit|nr:FAD-binding protein [Bosea sp. (in: a-proteobacteria)]
MSLFTPKTEDEAARLVADLALTKRPVTIQGGATRAGLGRPNQTEATISTLQMAGVTLHEPAELVISARAGTTVAEVEATLAAQNQMLPFEPMDHRLIYGTRGEPTIGGVVAGNHSGPRRIQAGACRDSLIGVRVINGRGEAIKSGGRVMKNVTGLDLAKLVTGSFGTLGLLTEVTFKVLPRPERTLTLLLKGLDDARAIAALSAALGSPFEPSAAAHLPAGLGRPQARTILRLEGFSVSLDYRIKALRKLLESFQELVVLEGEDSSSLWQGIRDCEFLAEPQDSALWRISTAPGRAPAMVAGIAANIGGARWFYDWGGGLVWLAVPPSSDAASATIRAAVASAGGHATLIRAPREVRASVDVFQPLGPLAGVTGGIKTSFDPAGIFEPGRMHAGI